MATHRRPRRRGLNWFLRFWYWSPAPAVLGWTTVVVGVLGMVVFG